jgi:hypothetical protein
VLHVRSLGSGTVLLGAALLAVGCGTSESRGDERAAAAPLPVYDWEPSGDIEHGDGALGTCRRVLLIGDSLAVQTAPFLQQIYDGYGYCAEVINAAVNGSAPATTSASGTRTDVFRYELALHQPDLVVAFFNGNGGLAQQRENAEATLAMIEVAKAHDAPMYWVLPPFSMVNCDSDHQRRDGFRRYRRWVMEHLPELVPTIDGNVLTPEAAAGSGLEAYNDTLRVDGVKRLVRDPDCVHPRTPAPSSSPTRWSTPPATSGATCPRRDDSRPGYESASSFRNAWCSR